MTHQVLLLLGLSMHVYDTTIYCIGDTADNTVASLNKALSDGTEQMVSRNPSLPLTEQSGKLYYWWEDNTSGQLSVTIGEDWIEWVKHTRLLGITIDDLLSWSHKKLTDEKKNC